MNSKAFEYFVKVLRNNTAALNYHKYVSKPVLLTNSFRYSTTTSKPADILDFYADLITQKFEKSQLENNLSPPVPLEKKPHTDKAFPTTSKVDLIISDMNTRNPHITSKMLANQLTVSLEKVDFPEISKIISFCIDKRMTLPGSLLCTIACKYSNHGLLDDLTLLQTLCKLDEEEYRNNAEFLHYFAYCYWICGNSTKCVKFLRECCDKYPTLNDVTKRILKMIISQAVSSRSQAQLVIITDFVKEFTDRFSDYYLLTVLWKELFLSEWFADQQLADELLDSNEELQKCITLIVPTLVSHLLGANKVDDVYRFTQVLLKYSLIDQYSMTLQILFDHHCTLNDKSRCAEIVKSSVALKAPLREEQYKQFISWTVFGSPSKYIDKAVMEKLYSSF
ncbi:uncharacterized protein LOC135840875 [Planococcus citri]|uniref:uncharacterized protein LOC135840875 n=1 Tax=Planococcus citri TaxID=170843 RepID=UPI0031F9654D